ncbi:hypothetical protein [uncultured Cutibacterium sp.]|uniref:DUF7937 domain-containing protein n=1 Tax=uncultured Cutibacterium sp. TaxID=1912223 RepID=UPI002596E48C|nr:hypothetical protein [uncultured Cutibacterium sp.]
MTTHKNTPEQQYRRAPVNGLIIGAVAGVAWVIVVLVGYVILEGLFIGSCTAELVVACVFPVTGWMTGLWGRRVFMCDDPKKRRRKAKIIGAVMATVTGMLMFVLATPLDAYTSWGVKESTAHLITLTICPLAGLFLGIIGTKPKDSNVSFVRDMSITAVIIVFVAATVWLILNFAIALSFVKITF